MIGESDLPRTATPVVHRMPDVPSVELVSLADIERFKSDFLRLIPVACKLYGYGEEDLPWLIATYLPKNVDLLRDHKALTSLRLVIRAWMIDMATNELDDMLRTDGSGGGGSELAERARSAFRQFVMGEECDENGRNYPGMWLNELAKLNSASGYSIAT